MKEMEVIAMLEEIYKLLGYEDVFTINSKEVKEYSLSLEKD